MLPCCIPHAWNIPFVNCIFLVRLVQVFTKVYLCVKCLCVKLGTFFQKFSFFFLFFLLVDSFQPQIQPLQVHRIIQKHIHTQYKIIPGNSKGVSGIRIKIFN